MGVPALFRWLSKKYPKIIYPVQEDEPSSMNPDGDEIEIPVNISLPNPNGVEFDNLYLDMNGIVHPCTHPEGKPAPATEEEMMVEIFKYTERIVNMIRPRKLLFMAIDGVAPRAKMNQQRSRRFRASQEAKDKMAVREENIAMWKAMGKEVTDEDNTPPWDSNAITPGTPFMDLLAASLKYWVVHKLNTDAAWKDLEILISDASVPGEGEHKIMDFIRRQRVNRGHDPNTHHVIYGLDADLIMLALATHEPNFRVLREDVFNDGSANACRICGQEGHYAAECTGTKADIQKPPNSDRKPFIFLDVAILREYLEVELDVPNVPFPFNLERAIDDWVLLIFFVGNDFLPHLPSLEIREGAIDVLLRIWKLELPRMGGYLTNHGQLEYARAQIILEGLAQREDEIFRKRKEADERQLQNAKRRKMEAGANGKGPSPSLGLSAPVNSVPAGQNPIHPSLPQKPALDFAAKADSIGLGGPVTAESISNVATATKALAGSNRDVVANRSAIRLANMSAAEVLKAELAGLSPVKPSPTLPPKPAPMPSDGTMDTSTNDSSASDANEAAPASPVAAPQATPEAPDDGTPLDVSSPVAGMKRTHDEMIEGDEEVSGEADDVEEEAPDADSALTFKVNPDGTVEQEDRVRLFEPGYQSRYYRQKFGVEWSDTEFKKKLTTAYVEGIAWVLHYYYQGPASWQWFYPYHFAPFAQDFEDMESMDIKFKLGEPFKPFEQLMGVFPAASRSHIPEPFHTLMTDTESPIIDFYPETFEIDMNGKRMAWQGVALLPFIDQDRLLGAMAKHYPSLTDDEHRRNAWGSNFMFACEGHSIYPFFEKLYGKRKDNNPIAINYHDNKGINGTVLPNPDCLPGSTYLSPLESQGFQDVKNDRSLSVLYFFPKQLRPHRSELLPGAIKPAPTLTASDFEAARSRGRGRGGPNRGGRGDHFRNDTFRGRGSPRGGHRRTDDYASARGGGPGPQYASYPSRESYPPPPRQHYNDYGGYGGYGRYGPPQPPQPDPYTRYNNPRADNYSYGYNNHGSYAGHGNNDYGGYGRGNYQGYGNYPPPPPLARGPPPSGQYRGRSW